MRSVFFVVFCAVVLFSGETRTAEAVTCNPTELSPCLPAFVLPGYWVSGIAALHSTRKGYLMRGVVWFVVPFSLATSLHLGDSRRVISIEWSRHWIGGDYWFTVNRKL
ncbi:hypothetical protein V6N13_017833 [Hibiscus sabdariffa]